jgi:hypothetical protein
VPRFVIFAQGFLGALDHCIDAVPLTVGVVQVKLLGTDGAFHCDLVGWGLDVGSGESDHGGAKLAYSLFVRYRESSASGAEALFLSGPNVGAEAPTHKDESGKKQIHR